MVNDPNQLVYDFRLDLERFGAEVENGATKVLRESAFTAAEAIVVGNQFGLGIPVDTGWARSAFGVGINAPAAGPTEPPMQVLQRGVNGHKNLARMVDVQKRKGLGQFPAARIDGTQKAVLGDTVYINTMAEYPQYLEFLTHLRRRFGKNMGKSTEFIAPVEARWLQIVEDAAKRVGYGT